MPGWRCSTTSTPAPPARSAHAGCLRAISPPPTAVPAGTPPGDRGADANAAAPSTVGFMAGDYEGTAAVPGGNVLSAFAVGGIPAAGQQFNQAMYEPTGGAPI